jgi:N,N'-diacetylchitobiose transport system substrate-binding protein
MMRFGKLSALVSVIVLLLAACGRGGERPEDAGRAGGDLEGSIRVWIMEPGIPALKEFFEKTTAAFEKEHPGAEVNLQFVPWASAHDQFVTAIGGGQVPDLAEMGTTWTPEFSAEGVLAPVEGDLGEKYLESLVEGATVGGRVYGLPWYAGARALIYRTDVFEQLGLEPPDSWEQLLAAGRAIRDRTDLSAFGVAGIVTHNFLPMVWQNGGKIAEQRQGRWVSRLDAPEAIEAIQFYADLYARERFAPEGALSWNHRDVRAAFEAGALAMMIGGAFDVRTILAGHPELEGKVGTVLLPKGPAGSRDTLAGGSHLVVFEQSREKELARAYADFLLVPDRVREFADEIGFHPGTIEGLEASRADATKLYEPFVTQLLSHSRTYPPVKEWGGFEGDQLFVGAVQQVMQGKKTARDAMVEVAGQMNERFKSG